MKQRTLIIINIISYVSLIIINTLAVRLPFFGRTPGDVSDLFPNLLTPANFAFKIWLVVYFLLGIFAFAQLKLLLKKDSGQHEETSAIGLLFFVSCILNFLWLMLWQSVTIAESFVLIFFLWIVLIHIYYRLSQITNTSWTYTIPFRVYLAWVCVASLANLNVLLIDSGFNFFGLTEEQWTATLIGIGILGTLLVIYLSKDIWFTLVLIWAFYGMYIKNMNLTNDFSWVVTMCRIAMTILICMTLLLLFKKRNQIRIKGPI